MSIGSKKWIHRFIQNFPFYFKDEFIFYKPDDFDNNLFMQNLAAEFSSTNQGDFFSTLVPVSISKIPIRVTFHFIPDNITVRIVFTLSLFESNLALLIFVVFGLFFNYFQNPVLFIVSIGSGLIYYFYNLHKTVTNIKKIIIRISGIPFDLGEPVLWKKQQEWMKNEKLCPACGEPKNPYSYKCVNCGIFFNNPPKHSSEIRSNTTGTANINYQYIKKNEKNSG